MCNDLSPKSNFLRYKSAYDLLINSIDITSQMCRLTFVKFLVEK